MNGHFFWGNPEKLGDVPFFTTVTTIKHRSTCARGFVFTDPKGHQRQGLGPWVSQRKGIELPSGKLTNIAMENHHF